MGDIVRRIVWFAIVLVAFSYAVFFVLGNFLTAQAEDQGPVQILDTLAPSSHTLTGMMFVPQSCDELLVRTEELATSTYELLFSTWEDPAVACSEDAVPREFRAALIAPSTGITFTASLDGRPIPILVTPTIPDRP